MAPADLSTTAQVRQQYELLPYPHRAPEDEAEGVVATTLDDLVKINHYCYRGRRDFSKDFRVLVAGGGTGDATIYLAGQLRGTDAEIVHLDLSEASIEVARARARFHGLEDRVCWQRGSLLDLPDRGLEPFDFIDCCGVLHHLEDPRQGLMALRAVLNDDGAMALFVYGRYGRNSIYLMQELMRIVNHDEHDRRVMVENAKILLESLPPTHCHKASVDVPEDGQWDDAEILDRYLHCRDRAYTVPELYDLLAGAGLNLVEFDRADRLLYCPEFAFSDPRILAQVKKLSKPWQQGAAELFWTAISRHVFWASPRSCSIADPAYPDNVPQWTPFSRTHSVQRSILKEERDTWTFRVQRADGVRFNFRMELSGVVRRIIELLDGERTIGEIVRAAAAGGEPALDVDMAWKAWLKIFGVLQSFDFALLRHVSVPVFEQPVTRAG